MKYFAECPVSYAPARILMPPVRVLSPRGWSHKRSVRVQMKWRRVFHGMVKLLVLVSVSWFVQPFVQLASVSSLVLIKCMPQSELKGKDRISWQINYLKFLMIVLKSHLNIECKGNMFRNASRNISIT